MSKPKEQPAPTTQIVERCDDSPYMMMPSQQTPLAQCPMSIDLSTDAGKARLVAATGVSDNDVQIGKTLEMHVTDYIVYPTTRVNEETGEASDFVRVVLIDKDGQTFATSSLVIASRLQAIVQLFGRGPWNPPLIMMMTKRQSRRPDRAFHDLRIRARDE